MGAYRCDVPGLSVPGLPVAGLCEHGVQGATHRCRGHFHRVLPEVVWSGTATSAATEPSSLVG